MGAAASGVAPVVPHYFEAQSMQLCGKHALNNLLQAPVFTRAALDALAAELTREDRASGMRRPPSYAGWFGNFDLRVLTAALARERCAVTEYLHAIPGRDDETVGRVLSLPFATLVGFLVNRPGRLSAHWLAVRQLDDARFYAFDSKRATAERLGSGTEADLVDYLCQMLAAGATVLAIGPTGPGDSFAAERVDPS